MTEHAAERPVGTREAILDSADIFAEEVQQVVLGVELLLRHTAGDAAEQVGVGGIGFEDHRRTSGRAVVDEKIYRAVRDQAAGAGLSYDSDSARY